jgi:hypothetical protein
MPAESQRFGLNVGKGPVAEFSHSLKTGHRPGRPDL